MSESSIKLPLEVEGGKKVRTIKQTVGADEVHSDVVALQDSEGNINDPLQGALLRLLLNTALTKFQFDAQGRLLIRIDVSGATTPVNITPANFGPFIYNGWDYAAYLSQSAFNGIRERMEFS